MSKLSAAKFGGLVFGVAFLLRLPSLFVPYYNNDEITNFIFGRFILGGEFELSDFLGNTYILTHYLYAGLIALSGAENLFFVHLVHAFWVGATALALFAAGRSLTGGMRGAAAAGLCYAIFSTTFFAKDFHAALAESFSLLPASLAAWAFFAALRKPAQIGRLSFLAGVGIGVSALFKAPSGAVIFALWISLLGLPRKVAVRAFLLSGVGLALALSTPFVVTGEPVAAFLTGLQKVRSIKVGYIDAYNYLSFAYLLSKYAIRTALVAFTALPLWFFSARTLRYFFVRSPAQSPAERRALFFLFLWVGVALAVVPLGKRLFFHYYVFFLPPLSLLAALSLSRIPSPRAALRRFKGREAYGLLSIMTLLSALIFMSDAVFRWTLDKPDASPIVSVIKEESRPSDRIYVWGSWPELYFASGREPASTMIWADTLAGLSMGSPAMEYMRARGESLNLRESILKDLKPSSQEQANFSPLSKTRLYSIGEEELLSMREILERVDSARWQTLFEDFFRHPPVLFLDTSPSDVHYFSCCPIEKYGLLKKFIDDHYSYLTTVDRVMVYKRN